MIGLGGIVFLLFLSGCDRHPEDTGPGDAFTGKVVEVLPDERRLKVEHGAVNGILEAGTTAFRASSGDIAILSPGKEIRARLIQGQNASDISLERIWPEDSVSVNIIEQHRRQLRQDTIIRGSGAFREVGEGMPNFALYDQEGDVFQSRSLRGSAYVLNFVYTRCPIPTMCPAATQRMIQLQEEARELGIDNFELVTITLDPDFDSPGILWQYANAFDIDTENFTLLTGPETAISDLMDQMGVLIEDDEELTSHTLSTVLVDDMGVIRHRAFGSNWLVSDFINKLQEVHDG